MIEQKHRILVVDDLPDWRDTLYGLLKDEGYYVKTASSSKSALAILSQETFDLAVLDIRLDDTDEDNIEGIDLQMRIKKRWPRVKVVMITGYPSVAAVTYTRQPGTELEADAFVFKRQVLQLLDKIQALLDN